MSARALLVVIAAAPLLLGGAYDPLPGIFHSKEEAANMDCRRISQAEAHALYPGEIPEPASRTLAGTTVDVLACQRRFVRLGERPARDELILTSLRQSAGEIVQSALGQPGLPADRTWHVDAYYPSLEVAAKIAVATRMELAEKGHRVSDRVPLLAAGDIAVVSRMKPKDAYPTACKRWFAEGALRESDVMLGVMIVDPSETQLHAGVCAKGEWRWLR